MWSGSHCGTCSIPKPEAGAGAGAGAGAETTVVGRSAGPMVDSRTRRIALVACVIAARSVGEQSGVTKLRILKRLALCLVTASGEQLTNQFDCVRVGFAGDYAVCCGQHASCGPGVEVASRW